MLNHLHPLSPLIQATILREEGIILPVLQIRKQAERLSDLLPQPRCESGLSNSKAGPLNQPPTRLQPNGGVAG